MNIRQKFNYILTVIFRLAIIFAIIYSIWQKDFFWAIIAGVLLWLSFLPSIIGRRLNLVLPVEIDFLLALVLFLHIAGNIFEWFDNFYPIFDKINHFLACFCVALIGFTGVIILQYYLKAIKLSHGLIIFFVLTFTIAAGTIWEVGEFAFDKLLHTDFQKGSSDTMMDLVVDSLAGLVAGFIAYFYFKGLKERPFYQQIIKINSRKL